MWNGFGNLTWEKSWFVTRFEEPPVTATRWMHGSAISGLAVGMLFRGILLRLKQKVVRVLLHVKKCSFEPIIWFSSSFGERNELTQVKAEKGRSTTVYYAQDLLCYRGKFTFPNWNREDQILHVYVSHSASYLPAHIAMHRIENAN
jgi:hypothetical protein